MKFKGLQDKVNQLKVKDAKLEEDNAKLQTQLKLTKEVDYRMLAKQLDAVNRELKEKKIIEIELEGRKTTLQNQVDELRFNLETMGDNKEHLINTKEGLENQIQNLTNKLSTQETVGKDVINLAYELRTKLKNKKYSYKDITRIRPATWENIKKDLEQIQKLVGLSEKKKNERHEQERKLRIALSKRSQEIENVSQELIVLKEELELSNPEAIRKRLRSILTNHRNIIVNAFEQPYTTIWVDLGIINKVDLGILRKEKFIKFIFADDLNVIVVEGQKVKIKRIIVKVNLSELPRTTRLILKKIVDDDIFFKKVHLKVKNIKKDQLETIETLGDIKLMTLTIETLDNLSLSTEKIVDFEELDVITKTIESNDVKDYIDFFKKKEDDEMGEFLSDLIPEKDWKSIEILTKKWKGLIDAGGLNKKESQIVDYLEKATKEGAERSDILTAVDNIKTLLAMSDESELPLLGSLPNAFVSTFESHERMKSVFKSKELEVKTLEGQIELGKSRENLLKSEIRLFQNRDHDTQDILKAANEDREQIETQRLAIVEMTEKFQKESEEAMTQLKVKQEEINKLSDKVEKVRGKKRGLKEELEKLRAEMEKNKNSAEVSSSNIYGRSWKGFVEWLTVNVYDLEKKERDVKGFGMYKTKPDKFYIKNLRKWKNKFSDDLLSNEYLYNFIVNIKKEKDIKEYDDNKNVKELCLAVIRLILSGKANKIIESDFQMLLDDYRQATALTTTVVRNTRDWSSFYDWLVINKDKYSSLFEFKYFIEDLELHLDGWKNGWKGRNSKVFVFAGDINEKRLFFDGKVSGLTSIRDENIEKWKESYGNEYEAMFQEWKKATPLASEKPPTETPQTTKPITTSNLVWNDFYWWMSEDKETGKGLWVHNFDSRNWRFLHEFWDAFTDQSDYFLPYEEKKDFTELLVPNTKLSKGILSLKEDDKKAYNDLLNDYRKTVIFVEYRKTWIDYLEWLQANITKDRNVDIEKLEIKDELKKEYPAISNFINPNDNFYSKLIKLVVNGVVKIKLNLCYEEELNIKPYEDNKDFLSLILKSSKDLNDENRQIFEELEKLLEKYRQETKTLKKQVLSNVPVGVVKSRTWQSFYDWLVINKTKYSSLWNISSFTYDLKTHIIGDEIEDMNRWRFKSYKEDQTLMNLVDYLDKISDENKKKYNQIFEDWKKDTPLQTTSGKELTEYENEALILVNNGLQLISEASKHPVKENIKLITGVKNDLELLMEKKSKLPLVGSYVEKYTKSMDEWVKNAVINKEKSETEAGAKVEFEKLTEKSWQSFYDWLLENKVNKKRGAYEVKAAGNARINQDVNQFMIGLANTIDGIKKKELKPEFDESQWTLVGKFYFLGKSEGVTYNSDTTKKLKCIAIEPKSVLIGGNDYFVKKIAYENNINEFENDSSASISRFEFWFNKPTGKLTKSFFEFQEVGNILKLFREKSDIIVTKTKSDISIFPNFDKEWIFADYFPRVKFFWGSKNQSTIKISSYDKVESWFREWLKSVPASSEEEKEYIQITQKIFKGLEKIGVDGFNPLIDNTPYYDYSNSDKDPRKIIVDLENNLSILNKKLESGSYPNLGILSTSFPKTAENVLLSYKEKWDKETESNDIIERLKKRIEETDKFYLENSLSLKHLAMYRKSRVLDLSSKDIKLPEKIGFSPSEVIYNQDVLDLLKRHDSFNLFYLKIGWLDYFYEDRKSSNILDLSQDSNLSVMILELDGHSIRRSGKEEKEIIWPIMVEGEELKSITTVRDNENSIFFRNKNKVWYADYGIKSISKNVLPSDPNNIDLTKWEKVSLKIKPRAIEDEMEEEVIEEVD